MPTRPVDDPMRILPGLSTLVLSLALVIAAGDRPWPEGRVVAGLAATAAGGTQVPAFTLFGWLSPPVESTTVARIGEMADDGMTLATPALDDSGNIAGRMADNLARLDLLAARGMRALVWDDRFSHVFAGDPSTPAALAGLDSVLADYRGRDAVLGWYMGDEPPASRFEQLGAISAVIRARDPGRFMWNNLLALGSFGSRDAWISYLSGYVAHVHPAVLCDDHYDFDTYGDRGLFIENVAGLAAVARASGIPFWCVIQLIPHANHRVVTPGLMAWQTSELLAYGARGIGYFTYWTPAPSPIWNWGDGLIARDGQRGPLYATVAALAPRLRAAGETLAGLTWLATEHAGSCPVGGTPFAPDDWIAAVEGRAALGEFADAGGTRFVLVANSDSSNAQAILLTLPHAVSVDTLGAGPGTWGPLPTVRGDGGARVALALDAGAFALLRVQGDFGAMRAGTGPALSAWPSPARGSVRFAYQGLAAGGRVELIDATGRRVWSGTPRAGAGLVTWDGSRDAGGTASPGVYFVRFEDARGVAAARVLWLGR
jgi:hypothetical protein